MEGISCRSTMVCAWADCPERAGMATPLRETPSLSLQAAQGEAGVGYFLAWFDSPPPLLLPPTRT